MELQPQLETARLVFLDESGFRLGSPPRFGWAPRGKKAPGKTVESHWTTITMIGAVALDGFRGFMTINSGTSTEVFRAFVEQELVANLRAGDILVMDNLSAHKNPRVLEAIRAVGADVVFTPPYSPEFNPIEKAWAKLKDAIRRAETLTRETFDQAVAHAMDTITPSDVSAWVGHCGYTLTST